MRTVRAKLSMVFKKKGRHMANFKNLKIFSGRSNEPLAKEICEYLDMSLGKAELKRFSDGESWVEIDDNVRGADIFVIQPTSHPANENLMELLIMIDALKRASADRITAVVPYYGYARQERKVKPRTPISAKLVADLITAAGANRMLSVDLHAGQIQGFFDIPFDHLYAKPVMVEYIKEKVHNDIVVVTPDAGGAERARSYGKELKAPLAMIDKRRPSANVSEVMHIIGDIEGKTAVIIDDMIDTAGTMVSAAEALIKDGAKEVYACCTHPVFSGPAINRITKSAIKEVVVTNTIKLNEAAEKCSKIKVLSVAKLLGEAIRRINNADSVSSLFM